MKESATRLLGSQEHIFTGVQAVQSPSLLAGIISRLIEVLGNNWETLVMASQANGKVEFLRAMFKMLVDLFRAVH